MARKSPAPAEKADEQAAPVSKTPTVDVANTDIVNKVGPRGFVGHPKRLLETEVLDLQGKIQELGASAEEHRTHMENALEFKAKLEDALKETQDALDLVVEEGE